MEPTLFRKQALEFQQEKLWGSVVASRPLAMSFLVWFLAVVTVLALAALAIGSYSRKATVEGHLVPDKGVIAIVSPGTGLISDIYVNPEELVAAGDALFQIDFDHTRGTDEPYTTALQQQLDTQISHLLQQLALEKQQLDGLSVHFSSQRSLHEAAIVRVQAMIKEEQKLADLRNSAVVRAASLYDRNLLARADLDAVRAQALVQEQEYTQLELGLMERQLNLRHLEDEYAAACITSRQHTAQLETELAALQQHRIQLYAETTTVVTAPMDARVSSILLHAGMSTGAGEQVLSLLPAGSRLQAELMIPSSAIGFVGSKQEISIRYDAFAYQKFGVQSGVVSNVAHDAETIRSEQGLPRPYFRVLADLEKQSITAFGAEQPLRPGMLLSADITLDERSLLEWLLEPLFSVRSSL